MSFTLQSTAPARSGGEHSSARSYQPLQRKSAGAGAARTVGAPAQRGDDSHAVDHTVPPIVNDVLVSAGQPLAALTRAQLEPRFGHDFSRVRVHVDSKAAESAEAVSSQAYTVGQHVVFGSGRYAPNSVPGLRLLAHELTHTIQQASFGAEAGRAHSSLRIESPTTVAEQAAERSRTRVGSDSTIAPVQQVALQRQPADAAPTTSDVDAGESLFTIFVADERKRRDKRFARKQAQVDAARIRQGGPLSNEDRQLVNAKLRFFEGEAWEVYAREVRPALVVATAGETQATSSGRKEAAEVAERRAEERRNYEGMQAYYASTRQSALERRDATLAKYREGVTRMTRREIYSQWGAAKEAFVAVASTRGHQLKSEQFFEIWLRHWDERWKIGGATVKRIEDREKEIDLRAYMLKRLRFENGENEILGSEFALAFADVGTAESMFRSSVNVMEYLRAADAQNKSATLDEVNNFAVFHDKLMADVRDAGAYLGSIPRLWGMIRPANIPRPRKVPKQLPPAAPAAPAKAGGGSPPSINKSTITASPPPPPAKAGGAPAPGVSRPTIKASPPPPPAKVNRISPPGAPRPMPATDAEVMANNVRSPSSVKPQDPSSHQNNWQKLGGADAAPPAYRDADGNIHVSTDHWLLKPAGRVGIPPVRPGGQVPTSARLPAPAARQPTPPAQSPAKPPLKGDVGTADTGQAPGVSPAAPDAFSKTPAAPAPPVRPPAAPKSKPGPQTAPAADESLQPMAPQSGPRWMPKDPPQSVSPAVVKRLGPRANYTVSPEAHKKAWQLLGGKGDAPPAFISEGNIYLDPSRWPPKTP